MRLNGSVANMHTRIFQTKNGSMLRIKNRKSAIIFEIEKNNVIESIYSHLHLLQRTLLHYSHT